MAGTYTSASTFRRSAIAVSTTAALLFSQNFAAAQNQKFTAATSATTQTDPCAKIPMESPERAVCIFQKWDKRIDDKRKVGEEADKRAAESLAVIDCVKFLTGKVKDGTAPKAEVLGKAGGKITHDNACELARSYGYVGRKADATPSLRAN